MPPSLKQSDERSRGTTQDRVEVPGATPHPYRRSGEPTARLLFMVGYVLALAATSSFVTYRILNALRNRRATDVNTGSGLVAGAPAQPTAPQGPVQRVADPPHRAGVHVTAPTSTACAAPQTEPTLAPKDQVGYCDDKGMKDAAAALPFAGSDSKAEKSRGEASSMGKRPGTDTKGSGTTSKLVSATKKEAGKNEGPSGFTSEPQVTTEPPPTKKFILLPPGTGDKLENSAIAKNAAKGP